VARIEAGGFATDLPNEFVPSQSSCDKCIGTARKSPVWPSNTCSQGF